MTILTTSEQCIGSMKPDGFYRMVRHGDRYQTPWCCDPFTVKQKVIDVNGNSKLTIDVTFKSPTGDVLFGWDLDSLLHLKAPSLLIDTLLRKGVRISPSSEAVSAILGAVQRPDLITSWGK